MDELIIKWFDSVGWTLDLLVYGQSAYFFVFLIYFSFFSPDIFVDN